MDPKPIPNDPIVPIKTKSHIWSNGIEGVLWTAEERKPLTWAHEDKVSHMGPAISTQIKLSSSLSALSANLFAVFRNLQLVSR